MIRTITNLPCQLLIATTYPNSTLFSISLFFLSTLILNPVELVQAKEMTGYRLAIIGLSVGLDLTGLTSSRFDLSFVPERLG